MEPQNPDDSGDPGTPGPTVDAGPDAEPPSPDAMPEPMIDAAVPLCPPGELAPGDDLDIEIEHDGLTRRYNVHVGDSVDPQRPAPLLLNFHGLNNSPAIQEAFSGMKAVADEQGFIVVYPAGLGASFNAGSCCGSSSSRGIDDLGFSRAIVEDVSVRACVDASRVYATGFSNGGYMANLLACRASDVFAAIAPVAGAMGVRDCEPERAVPIIGFHGTADVVVPYRSGEDAIDGWRERNGCSAEPERVEIGRSYCDIWRDCDGGVAVELCSIVGWNHLWPNGVTSIPASPRIWEFLSRYRHPAPRP